MYDRVLLPIDLSAGVDRGIAHAIDTADRYNAELHILYVVDVETYSSYPGDEYVHEFEGIESALQRAGQDAIEAIAERANEAGIETVTVIRQGVPHQEILAYADAADIGLIVVGSKHRSGEYRLLLGSVAERVARHSERPVTIVKTPVSDS